MKNQIEKVIILNATITRVWSALTDHEEFGSWFRLSLHDPFRVGEVTSGVVTFPGHEGLPFWARVKVMERPYRFSFIWPMDETVQPDDSDLAGKVTLVEFLLETCEGGSKLTIRESGFDNLPERKRLAVFRDNLSGWDAQTKNIREHIG